jgi:hypothetical protein
VVDPNVGALPSSKPVEVTLEPYDGPGSKPAHKIRGSGPKLGLGTTESRRAIGFDSGLSVAGNLTAHDSQRIGIERKHEQSARHDA